MFRGIALVLADDGCDCGGRAGGVFIAGTEGGSDCAGARTRRGISFYNAARSALN